MKEIEEKINQAKHRLFHWKALICSIVNPKSLWYEDDDVALKTILAALAEPGAPCEIAQAEQSYRSSMDTLNKLPEPVTAGERKDAVELFNDLVELSGIEIWDEKKKRLKDLIRLLILGNQGGVSEEKGIRLAEHFEMVFRDANSRADCPECQEIRAILGNQSGAVEAGDCFNCPNDETNGGRCELLSSECPLPPKQKGGPSEEERRQLVKVYDFQTAWIRDKFKEYPNDWLWENVVKECDQIRALILGNTAPGRGEKCEHEKK